MKKFDSNKVAVPNGNLWALPFSVDESALVIIPRPIDITTSFRDGTRDGPAAILAASTQIDLHDEDYPNMWKKGIVLLPNGRRDPSYSINHYIRMRAQEVMCHLEKGGCMETVLDDLQHVNNFMQRKTDELRNMSEQYIEKGKLVAVLGGDHSTPLGLMQALAKRHKEFGVLHIDAHLDLRESYEGFEQSHASIMRNASKIPQISRFEHIGIRDFCDEEVAFITEYLMRHGLLSDRIIHRHAHVSGGWQDILNVAVSKLPHEVYVSFDIDGLDPSLCPNTGTPVPGGLQYEEAFLFVEEIVNSGRRIIGFDLVEVSPASNDPTTWATDWNANVGMRVLYRLSTLALASQKNA